MRSTYMAEYFLQVFQNSLCFLFCNSLKAAKRPTALSSTSIPTLLVHMCQNLRFWDLLIYYKPQSRECSYALPLWPLSVSHNQ